MGRSGKSVSRKVRASIARAFDMKSYALSDLVFDTDLYPRERVDESHVERLRNAILASCKLPPLVICEETKRVVDGLHRSEAYRALFGDDHEVLCAEKSYADPSELFQDAVRLNMSHGLPIRKEDYKLIAAKGERLGVSHSGVQGLLNVSGDSATWLLRAAVPKPKPASAVAPAFSERGFNNGWRNRAQGLPSPPPKPKCLDCDRPAMDDAVRCVECMAKLSHRTASRSGLLYSGDDFEEHATESLVPIDDDKLDDIRFDNSAQERLAVLRAAKSSESELAFYAEKVRRVIDMRMNSGQRFSESETEELSELRSALLRMFTAA